jgi:hypothetical protein
MGLPPPPRSVAHCLGTRSRPMDCSNHREAFAFRNRAHQLRADQQRALLVEERCGGASGGGLAEPHWPARLRAMTPLSLQAVLPSLHRRSSSAVRVCACVHVGEQTCASESTKNAQQFAAEKPSFGWVQQYWPCRVGIATNTTWDARAWLEGMAQCRLFPWCWHATKQQVCLDVMM